MKMRFNWSFMVWLIALGPEIAVAATNDLTTLLQRGLFEEEANRNLDAAATAYRSLVTEFDRDRQIASTAIFRLAEVYRKQGRTNDAILQYERITREFSDQPSLLTLSRQNLLALRPGSDLPVGESGDVTAGQRRLIEREIELVQQQLQAQKHLEEVGRGNTGETTRLERELLSLQRQLLSVHTTPGAGRTDADLTTDEEQQEIRRIEAMIQNSPDLINAPSGGPPPMTPLARAASRGQLQVARFLLQANADVSLRSGGQAPLHHAAGGGHRAMVELLLQHGSEVDAGSANGQTPLHLTAERGFLSVMDQLLAAGPNPDALDNVGNTPLILAVQKGRRPAAARLLTHGADPNKVVSKLPPGYGDSDSLLGTALHFAAHRGDVGITELLLSNRADLEIRSPRLNRTPLELSALRGDSEIVRRLLVAGASPNGTNGSFGPYAIHLAVQEDRTDVVTLLLQKGVDPNLPCFHRYTSGWTPLMEAIKSGNEEIMAALLKAKADPNRRDGNRLSAFWHVLALGGETLEKARMLLEHGADPNSLSPMGKTPLMGVVELQNVVPTARLELARLLIAKGARVDDLDQEGNTALHLAVATRQPGLVELLLTNGASVNLQNRDGQTALDLAKIPAGPFPVRSRRIQMFAEDTPPVGIVQPLESVSYGMAGADPGISDLLRTHGALDQVPKFDVIQVRRGGQSQVIVRETTSDWSRLSLFEVIGIQYDLLSASVTEPRRVNSRPYGNGESENWLRFPDFTRILIHRPSATGTNWETIRIDVEEALNSTNCNADVPLQFGDVVEVPEEEHVLGRQWMGLSTENLFALKHCLARTLRLVIHGKMTNLTVEPRVAHAPDRPYLTLLRHEPFMIWPVLENSRLLLTSSDLSRVKATRTDRNTGEKKEWVLDCGDPANRPAFWLRDGDVIEVTEKEESEAGNRNLRTIPSRTRGEPLPSRQPPTRQQRTN